MPPERLLGGAGKLWGVHGQEVTQVAARGKKSGSGAGFLGTFAWVVLLVAVGVGGGYAWRSYAPLPLPEPLGRPANPAREEELAALVVSATERARLAEEERDDLARKLREVETGRNAAERELADMKIKDVLTGE